MLHQDAMQGGASNAAPGSRRKIAGCGRAAIHKTDAPERKRVAILDSHSQARESGERVRHQTFAARLVGGRNDPIGNCHPETAFSQRDGGGEPGRSSADNEYVCT
jgi:hypothetical protein